MNFWKWLDGKKSKIALAYWTIVIPSLPVLYPAGVPDTMEKIVTVIGISLSAIGLGHAGYKAVQGKRQALEQVSQQPIREPELESVTPAIQCSRFKPGSNTASPKPSPLSPHPAEASGELEKAVGRTR